MLFSLAVAAGQVDETCPAAYQRNASSVAQPTELEVFMSPQHADEKMLLGQVLRQLLPEEVTPLANPDKRAITVFRESGSSQNIIEFFTRVSGRPLQTGCWLKRCVVRDVPLWAS
jgi:hypothetical protein